MTLSEICAWPKRSLKATTIFSVKKISRNDWAIFLFSLLSLFITVTVFAQTTVPQWDDPSPAAFWGKTAEHWSPTRYCKQNNFLLLAAIFILLHWANFDNDSKSFSMKQMAYIIVAVQCASTVGVFTRSSATRVNLLSSSTSYGSHRHSFGLQRIALGKH